MALFNRIVTGIAPDGDLIYEAKGFGSYEGDGEMSLNDRIIALKQKGEGLKLGPQTTELVAEWEKLAIDFAGRVSAIESNVAIEKARVLKIRNDLAQYQEAYKNLELGYKNNVLEMGRIKATTISFDVVTKRFTSLFKLLGMPDSAVVTNDTDLLRLADSLWKKFAPQHEEDLVP